MSLKYFLYRDPTQAWSGIALYRFKGLITRHFYTICIISSVGFKQAPWPCIPGPVVIARLQ